VSRPTTVPDSTDPAGHTASTDSTDHTDSTDYTEDTRAVLAVLTAHGHSGLPPATAARARAGTALAAVIGPPPPVAEVTAATAPGPGGPIPLTVYRPVADPRPRPGLVYFHGGGFVLDGARSHDGFLRALAEGTGHVVVAVDYRLAPEHPFPAAVDDAEAATRHVASYAGEFGIDPDRLSVAGDSAGANLAAVVAQSARTAGEPSLAAQVLIVPQTLQPPRADTGSRRRFGHGPYLTAELLAWFADQYVPRAEDRTDPRAAPALAPDLTGLPPALVVTAGLDPLRDEGEQYARSLAAAGVPVRQWRLEGAFHLLWLATKTAPAVQADLVARIAAHLDHPR
jgi:acetyl esterase